MVQLQIWSLRGPGDAPDLTSSLSGQSLHLGMGLVVVVAKTSVVTIIVRDLLKTFALVFALVHATWLSQSLETLSLASFGQLGSPTPGDQAGLFLDSLAWRGRSG